MNHILLASFLLQKVSQGILEFYFHSKPRCWWGGDGHCKLVTNTLELQLPDHSSTIYDYHTSETYSTVISISKEELKPWKVAYCQDSHLSQVFKVEEEKDIDKYSQYQIRMNRLIYFEDWNRNHQLVVLESLWVDIMSEVHNTITKAAHRGYAKT